MTNDERIALLRRVAEVAPKEMGAREWGRWVKFYNPRIYKGDWPKFNLFESDSENAVAIIAMLDAMENAGWIVALVWCAPSDYDCEYYRSGDQGGGNTVNATTRAEAVARAFVRVFGGD